MSPEPGSGRRDRGQATLELAVVTPVIVVLLLAVLQVGLLGVRRIAVSAAAREGARVAAVSSDVESIRRAVRSAAPGEAEGLSVDIRRPEAAGEALSVTVTDVVRPSVPLVSMLFPATVTMRATARMAVEVP